jgi:hypothetical protein
MTDDFEGLAWDLKVAFAQSTFAKSPEEPWTDEVFDAWATRIFAYQFESNAVYGAYSSKRGATPSTVRHWHEVPPVPAAAFKTLPLISGDPALVQRVFRTSGTTRGRAGRGEHHVLDLDLYRASLVPNMRRHLYGGAAKLPLFALVPDPLVAPDSSLSFMLGEALTTLSDGEGAFFVEEDGRMDEEGLWRGLMEATSEGQPVVVAGTASALVHWLDWMTEVGQRLELPPGSRIMDTGGFKGRSRTLSRLDLYRQLSVAHGVPLQNIVNEYGMTELLSQYYEVSAPERAGTDLEDRRHVAPPWLRVRVLDPITLEAVPAGQPGLLCHYDLANAGSVIAVLTEDLGVEDAGGLRVLGRVAGAEPRGCSLAMDALLSQGESR